MAGTQGVSLKHVSAASPVPPVEVDPERIGQVLRNLIHNAITYSPSGGEVRVRVEVAADHVRISVSDTGPGIPPEALPYVFDRFYRADRSRARRTGGSGLGLAICKALVEMHGGSITVESQPGQGATFAFTLPVS
jgi:signal transduction histidine kinase